jgi:hypothetical protein
MILVHILAIIYKEYALICYTRLPKPVHRYFTGYIEIARERLLLERRQSLNVVNFGLVFRLGNGSFDVVALGSGVRVEESVDTLERKETSFGNEEVYERCGELLTTS